MMPNLSSLMASEVVITTSDATSGDKNGPMTRPGFQLSHKPVVEWYTDAYMPQ